LAKVAERPVLDRPDPVDLAPQSQGTRPGTRLLNLTFVVIVPGAGVILALATLLMGRVQPLHVGMFVAGWILTGLGITVGFHRLATHRSFETNRVVKAVLWILGSMAIEGPVTEWAANHLKHHAYTEKPNDPHTPNDGFWWAHIGWLLPATEVETKKYAPFLLRDPVAMFVSNTFVLWVTLSYIIPFVIGGLITWSAEGAVVGLIWGGLFRQFAVQHVTFAVNSVCHRYGSRPFRTGDLSTNNWVVGILGHGEGWHNNHHAFPTSAFHGLRWWEFDLSAYVIRALAALRLAWNVKRPTLLQMQDRRAVNA
jgi:stearoyl-CoA desaturase (Delta-9 desaturase)